MPNKIYVRLRGGLGNQMFQYAFGRAVAESTRSTLYIDDKTGFVRDPYIRSADLLRLPITSFCKKPKLNRFAHAAAMLRLPDRVIAFLENSAINKKIRVYTEKKLFLYDPGVFNVPHDTYFFGYWQNPRYFEKQSQQIREELTANVPLNKYASSLLKKISISESVAIHIRKYDQADKLLFKKQVTDHLTLPPAYYERAIRLMASTVTNPFYFIFSDEVNSNFSLLGKNSSIRVDSGMIADDLTEHWLMCQCRHQIIANSTFSWWAAWLNKNPYKNVVAPFRWFNNELPAQNILPGEWRIVSSN